MLVFSRGLLHGVVIAGGVCDWWRFVQSAWGSGQIDYHVQSCWFTACWPSLRMCKEAMHIVARSRASDSCLMLDCVRVINFRIIIIFLKIFLPIGTSFPGDRKLAKSRSVSGMVTTGTQKQSTSWSDMQHWNAELPQKSADIGTCLIIIIIIIIIIVKYSSADSVDDQWCCRIRFTIMC